MSTPPSLSPPIAKIAPHVMTVHGDTRVDNYFWLRDRSDPDTLTYLENENRYTEARMEHTKPVEQALYSEMLGRIQETDSSAPVPHGPYLYYTRTEAGKQYALHCRKHQALNSVEEILLDGNILAEGQKYFRIGNFAPSPDHKLLAYSVDFDGDETYTILVKNLATGELLMDEIPNTYYTLEWANDNQTFFYTILDAALRPYKVFRHVLGAKKDALVYHETDERFTLELAATRSREFVFINIGSPITSEVRYLHANQPGGELTVLLPRVHGVEYDAAHRGESFFIRTSDGAKGFRLVEAPVSNPSKANWQEVIPGRDAVTIESVHAFANYLVTEQRRNGLKEIYVHDFRTGADYAIDFPEPSYSVEIGHNYEFSSDMLRFEYTSLKAPRSDFDFNLQTRERVLIKQQPVRGGYDPALYHSERIFATAADGVRVPISLVYRNDFVRNGRAPMLLYGYGSYGISMDASFRADRLSLIDRGFVYAIAHIRGGMDMGKPWHEDGRMLKKKNTFQDFIACAEHLIAEKYSSASRLSIMGGSAGGLLMGAVMNARPDLFAAVVAMVPFVDSLNTALDATLPLTIGEYEEFGNPANQEFYAYMKSYAPYENVHAAEYPALLITTGLNDPRVSYWEPAKWIAKLRSLKQNDRPMLLKVNMGSGHFGSSGRYEHLKETAFHDAFLLDVLNLLH